MKKPGFHVYLILAFLLVSTFIMQGCGSKSSSVTARPARIDAVVAKQLLSEGNTRFVSGEVAKKDLATARQTIALKGQKPFAVVLACAESDVPPEILFDQNLGDLLVIRTVGNVVDDLVMGSVEYGVEHYKAPLVVVLGHTNCGIVKETVENKEQCPGNIPKISEKMKSAVERAKGTKLKGQDLFKRAEENHLWDVKAQIEESPIVKEFKGMAGLQVIAAKYDAATGQVQFYEDNGCDLGEDIIIPNKSSITENSKNNVEKTPQKQWQKPTDKLEQLAHYLCNLVIAKRYIINSFKFWLMFLI